MSLHSVKAQMLLETTIFWLSATSFDRTYQKSPPPMIPFFIAGLMMEREGIQNKISVCRSPIFKMPNDICFYWNSPKNFIFTLE